MPSQFVAPDFQAAQFPDAFSLRVGDPTWNGLDAGYDLPTKEDGDDVLVIPIGTEWTGAVSLGCSQGLA